MDRKTFLKKGLLGTGMFAVAPALGKVLNNEIDELQPLDIIGFNHIPNPEEIVMENTVIHKSTSRGYADHGWLKSYHSFSFANYYNPERMHFGVLRVLNDDYVAGGKGFGTHPHDNMEIISIPLDGDLEHKDSMGNVAIIKEGDIQVMSAGTGIQHSEFNKNGDKPVKFLQIWVFPNKRNVKPRYEQITLNKKDRKNKFQQIVSPSANDEGVWIHQDAWFHLGDFDAGQSVNYKIKRAGNGAYLFVLKGKVKVNNQTLDARDAMGIWNMSELAIKTDANAELLLMDVPMVLR
jgi:redox-sensitive bicupin YhaK (pirin superfamily)